MKAAITDYLCWCVGLVAGVMLLGVYEVLVSLIFIGVGIDSLTILSSNASSKSDTILYSVYAMVIVSSVLLALASLALIIGASRKYKSYLLPWLIVTPLWTVIVLSQMIILPQMISNAVKLSAEHVLIGGTTFLVLFNVYGFVCTIALFLKFTRVPKNQLKSVTVVEALSNGFTNAHRQIRKSFRRRKEQPTAQYRASQSSVSIQMPTLDGSGTSVVLTPSMFLSNTSHSPIKGNAKKVTTSHVRSAILKDRLADASLVSDNAQASLALEQELRHSEEWGGIVNPAFQDDELPKQF